MDIKEGEVLGDAVHQHWYYKNKARMLQRLLPHDFNRVVMDVGSGSGFFPKHLAEQGLIDRALCVDIGYHDNRDEDHAGANLLFRNAPEYCDASAVLFMDVLEHVEDDAGLLNSYRSMVPDNAVSIITVPAFNFLWSGHDVFLAHYRRYTVRTLTETIVRAGYRPIQVHFYYGLVFPLALAVRMLNPQRMAVKSNLKKHHPAINSVLDVACQIELPTMQMNRLFGLSVCAVCRPN